MNEGFLSHRGTFSSHPFIDGIFPNKNHPAIGVPSILGTPLMVQWISESQSAENSSRRTLLCIKVLAIIVPRRKASGMIIRAFVQPPVIFFGALTRLEKKRTRQFGKNQLWKDTKLTFLTCSLASWLPVRLPMHTWALQRAGAASWGSWLVAPQEYGHSVRWCLKRWVPPEQWQALGSMYGKLQEENTTGRERKIHLHVEPICTIVQ